MVFATLPDMEMVIAAIPIHLVLLCFSHRLDFGQPRLVGMPALGWPLHYSEAMPRNIQALSMVLARPVAFLSSMARVPVISKQTAGPHLSS